MLLHLQKCVAMTNLNVEEPELPIPETHTYTNLTDAAKFAKGIIQGYADHLKTTIEGVKVRYTEKNGWLRITNDVTKLSKDHPFALDIVYTSNKDAGDTQLSKEKAFEMLMNLHQGTQTYTLGPVRPKNAI